jgi:periplasmic protein TonB
VSILDDPAVRRGLAVLAAASIHTAIVLPLLGLKVKTPAPQAVLVGVQIAAATPPALEPVRTHPSPALARSTVSTIATTRPSATQASATVSEPAPAEKPAAESAPVVAAAPARAAPAVEGEAATQPDFRAAYLDNPRPPYPPLSRRLREQGHIRLHVHVTPEGRADNVQILTGSGFERLDLAARNAVQAWRFVPAHQHGTAIAAWVEVPIQFELEP